VFLRNKITKLLDLKENRVLCVILLLKDVTLWSPCRWNFRSSYWQSLAWFVV